MCQVKQSKDVVCPTCGTCPTCGKKVWDYTYYYIPYQPYPTWSGSIATGYSAVVNEEDKQDGK